MGEGPLDQWIGAVRVPAVEERVSHRLEEREGLRLGLEPPTMAPSPREEPTITETVGLALSPEAKLALVDGVQSTRMDGTRRRSRTQPVDTIERASPGARVLEVAVLGHVGQTEDRIL